MASTQENESGTELQRPNAPDSRAAALAGAISGTVSVSATYPLDLVRTRLALERSIPQPTLFAAFRRIASEEGVAALFRGIRPAIISNAPAAGIFFMCYTHAQQYVPSSSTNAQFSVAAGVAYITTCIAMNPLWVVKTRFQAQATGKRVKSSSLKYGKVVQALRLVYRENGLRGLYSGTLAACAVAPGVMVQMPMYEYIKRGGIGNSEEEPSAARIGVASAASSAVVSLISFPAEVVRLRLQAQGMKGETSPSYTKYNGVVDAFRTILKQEGPRALYRGLSASLVRTVPNSAIALLTYETMLRMTTSIVEVADELIGTSRT